MKIVIKRTTAQEFRLENVSSQDLISAATTMGMGSDAMPGDGELHEDFVERLLGDSDTLNMLVLRHGRADDLSEEFALVEVEFDD